MNFAEIEESGVMNKDQKVIAIGTKYEHRLILDALDFYIASNKRLKLVKNLRDDYYNKAPIN